MCQKILQGYENIGHSMVEIVKEEDSIVPAATEVRGAGDKIPGAVWPWRGDGAEVSAAEWRGGGAEVSAAEWRGDGAVTSTARRGDGASVKSIAEMRSREGAAVVTIAEEVNGRRGSAMSTAGEEKRAVDGIYYEWRGGGAVMSTGRLESENIMSANSTSQVGGQVITMRSPRNTRLVMEVAVCDDRAFLDSWKKYVRKHFASSCSDKDVQNAVEYLCTLARTNLEMTELCLRRLRRFVVLQQYDLSPTFDMILQQVQEEVKECYNGVLKIEPLT